jgi:putative transposase
LYIDIPLKIAKNKIKYIEIKPIYENHKYKICIVYEDLSESIKISNKITTNDCISIDLGVKALMTIYDPSGQQKIIDGGYINWLNKSYNHKIDMLKNNIKTVNGISTSKKIRNLLIKRTNRINYYFDHVVKWFSLNYSHKKLIVIGYNGKWKQSTQMGPIVNRAFSSIPYSVLLKKLKEKMRKIGVDVQTHEESYTSVCDALGLEEICFHETYMGDRSKRGLYSSSVGKLLNADINGAINIMRKYFLKIKQKIVIDVNGDLYNPIRVHIPCEVPNRQVRNQFGQRLP